MNKTLNLSFNLKSRPVRVEVIKTCIELRHEGFRSAIEWMVIDR